MKQATVGIIGGSGLGEVLREQAKGETVAIDTPFGPPSCDPIVSTWEGVDVAFILRHGEGHHLNPSSVPYRANIWALKQLGVSAILASGATGSLRDEVSPGQLLICDQVIDKTYRRAPTFFDEGVVVHVELADPFCPMLRAAILAAGERLAITVHDGGTYVCMEGPQFSTRAESLMHRAWGGDLIGMTCMPEARLAREAEICYALIAMPTDYDCWRKAPEGQAPDELLSEILSNLRSATDNAIMLMRETLKGWSDWNDGCRCRSALRRAIWSDRAGIPSAVRERLGLLLAKYLTE